MGIRLSKPENSSAESCQYFANKFENYRSADCFATSNQEAVGFNGLDEGAHSAGYTKPLVGLRKRLLKGLSYDPNDPRSPCTQFDRTPLVFEDSHNKTLNLDDTFADLFVDTSPPLTMTEAPDQMVIMKNSKVMQTNDEEASEFLETYENCTTQQREEKTIYEEEETMFNSAILIPKYVAEQEVNDPRSPTFGLNRTPLILTDNDEATEDEMLETVLTKLHLNLSSESTNWTTGTFESKINDSNKALNRKPINRRLDHVRGVKKRTTKNSPRYSIYKDCENANDNSPKLNVSPLGQRNGERTPLSCLGNHQRGPLCTGKLNQQETFAILSSSSK